MKNISDIKHLFNVSKQSEFIALSNDFILVLNILSKRSPKNSNYYFPYRLRQRNHLIKSSDTITFRYFIQFFYNHFHNFHFQEPTTNRNLKAKIFSINWTKLMRKLTKEVDFILRAIRKPAKCTLLMIFLFPSEKYGRKKYNSIYRRLLKMKCSR